MDRARRTTDTTVELRISVTDGASPVVALSGDLDDLGVAAVRGSLLPLGDGAERSVVVDVGDVGIFGSKAIRLLEELQDRLVSGSVHLTNLPRHVEVVLKAVGSPFPVDDSARSSLDGGLIAGPGFERTIAQAVMRGREAVCITDDDLDSPDGPRIVFVNRAFTDLTGYPADEVLGETPRVLQGPLTSRSVLDRLKSNLRSGEPFAGEAVNYRADGSPFVMNWRVIELAEGSHGRRFFLAMQSDGTELRRLSRFEACLTYVDRARQLARNRPSGVDDDAVVDAMLAAQVALLGDGEAAASHRDRTGARRFHTSAVDPDVRADLERLATSPPHQPRGTRQSMVVDGGLVIDAGERDARLVITDAHPDRLRLADPHLHQQLLLYALRDELAG